MTYLKHFFLVKPLKTVLLFQVVINPDYAIESISSSKSSVSRRGNCFFQ